MPDETGDHAGGLTKLEIVAWGATGAAHGTKIDCQFNPASLSFQKQNAWKEVQAKGIKDAPDLRFISAGSETITLDLTFDTTDTGKPVTEKTDQLMQLMQVNKDSKQSRPPDLLLQWGANYISPQMVVTAIDVRYTYFASDGTPLRAQVKLSLRQVSETPVFKQNPTSHTPKPHKVHTVLPGESLDRIAWVHYGDPSQWRRLAEANDLIDPLSLQAGQLLMVPEIGR
jgi:phage protein U